MLRNKGSDIRALTGLPMKSATSIRKEIGMIDEAVDVAEIDVIGIDEIRAFVAERLDRSIGGKTRVQRLGMNDVVFAVDLFQTGVMATPSSVRALRIAESCAAP